MSQVMQGLYYSKEHEWVRVEGDLAFVGISDHAQQAMGDFVFVDCGATGAQVSAGDAVAVLESVKAASDVYTPLSGTVVQINEALADAPETLNADPYGSFIFALEMSDQGELAALMDADAYAAVCEAAA